MPTHIFRTDSGEDLFSFVYSTLQSSSSNKVRYQLCYSDVVILNDISGYWTTEDGEKIDETKPYTVKAGTKMEDFCTVYTVEKLGKKYLSLVIEEGDNLFEVRVEF